MLDMTKGIFSIVLAVMAGTLSVQASTAGWRGDGTGRYPQAKPAAEWSQEKNVIWKTAIAEWSNASPVIQGDKVFVCAEPSTLICIDKKSGRILWEKTVTLEDLAKDEQEKAKIKESLAKMSVLQRELDSNTQKARAQRQKIKANPEDKELRKVVKELSTKIAATKEKMKAYQEYANPPRHAANGYTSPTPVSDGKKVYALFGVGFSMCCDFDGKLVWARKLEKPGHKWGSCMSPLLVDGMLIVQINNMYGLDPATGDEKWKVACGAGWGSPVTHSAGGESFIFTCKGDVVKAATGEIVAKGLHNLGYGGPVADAGTVYYIQDQAKAYELPAKLESGVELKPAWESIIKKDRYYGSPLIHDGLIYAITRTGILSVLDAKTGEKAYEENVPFKESSTVYPSITLGGKNIYISNEKGHTVVIKPGKKFESVAMSQLDGFRSCPVFEGGRMYIRTLSHLYCIGE